MTKPHHILENAGYLRADFPGRRVCFFGHTHEQKVFEVDGDRVTEVPASETVRLDLRREYFVNPGSVDASRKRAHKLAEYAVFDSSASTVRFERTPYDDRTTESKASAGGFRIDRWRDRLYDVQRRVIGPRHIEG
jgi:predicted phosphodiesterase